MPELSVSSSFANECPSCQLPLPMPRPRVVLPRIGRRRLPRLLSIHPRLRLSAWPSFVRRSQQQRDPLASQNKHPQMPRHRLPAPRRLRPHRPPPRGPQSSRWSLARSPPRLVRFLAPLKNTDRPTCCLPTPA